MVVSQKAGHPGRGDARGLRLHLGCYADIARAHYRLQLFHGHKPLRPTQNYEEAEANAIGTEYLRADLLPAANAASVRALLRNYLDQRVLFYTTQNEHELQQINARTTQLQTELWSAVRAPAAAQPTPIVALAVSGMNDVLNSQGYTQAGYWNRIPVAAWALMAAIAVGCNLLVGYGSRSVKAGSKLLPILPLVVSVAFMLIADIDSPRHGIIRVRPQNLISLAESLQPPGGIP